MTADIVTISLGKLELTSLLTLLLSILMVVADSEYPPVGLAGLAKPISISSPTDRKSHASEARGQIHSGLDCQGK